ncbi:GNAT family N-acetyltransferase [Streptomyces sp. NPDC014889]|uniref:GNAT family N-acetyltransferase n=1 Tax=Streptomyces sp. NPDC014889 TaxID=3364928 RepID=UPI0036FF4275
MAGDHEHLEAQAAPGVRTCHGCWARSRRTTRTRTLRVPRSRSGLLGPSPCGHGPYRAWDDGEPLGFASYSWLWPAAGAEVSLYLKELFVRVPYRRHGVGAELMDAVQAAAAGLGCSRRSGPPTRTTPRPSPSMRRAGPGGTTARSCTEWR